LLAAVGDAGDELLGDADVEVPGGEVVEEEQGTPACIPTAKAFRVLTSGS
jgi:hypothetical protein